MSKYRVIKTEFKNGESLVKALSDMGLPFEKAASLRENGLTLETHWNSFGGVNKQVAIGMSRGSLRTHGLQVMDGIGFTWSGQGYDVVIDHYDEEKSQVTAMLAQLKQRYGLHEVNRLARQKGYTVRESASAADGTIRLILVKR